MGNPDYDRGTCITQAALQQFFQVGRSSPLGDFLYSVLMCLHLWEGARSAHRIALFSTCIDVMSHGETVEHRRYDPSSLLIARLDSRTVSESVWLRSRFHIQADS